MRFCRAATPDGQRILSGGADCTVRVWLLDGTLVNAFELHDYAVAVNAFAALPDNQHALGSAGRLNKSIKLFNAINGAVLRTFSHHMAVTSPALLDGLRFEAAVPPTTARIATTASRSAVFAAVRGPEN